MGAVVTYAIYLVISISLTAGAGLALSRSGRVFLRDVFGGDDALAQAVNRLLVVGFYLLMLGFVVLAMRPSGQITGARQASREPGRPPGCCRSRSGRCSWSWARCTW
jgi:hypothetical protein